MSIINLSVLAVMPFILVKPPFISRLRSMSTSKRARDLISTRQNTQAELVTIVKLVIILHSESSMKQALRTPSKSKKECTSDDTTNRCMASGGGGGVFTSPCCKIFHEKYRQILCILCIGHVTKFLLSDL